ncbi:hypothetical protein BJ875DRAFT_473218 [Amylocarpus encephaloides]|uniref:PH domain-containing protein n=1 Tax=Amylocarpus encephaloides TaxID=45428 RepID=A0A9P8C189_9HELO|nr:hypothetical protein BJ875DRAFT_473218 [Amylocarpus encephaloides]
MTSFITKTIAKKILGERLENNYGKEDPYFETVPATRLDGTPSTKKVKKRRKALPPGITEHDGRVLTKVKRRAYRLDLSLFNCLGIRFGWSSVIAIVPVIGDALDALMALMVFRTCQQVEGGLPKSVATKMICNIFIDFLIGLLPLVGDLMDALYKANTKNAIVLEQYLREKGAKTLKQQGRTPSRDATDPDEFDQQLMEEHGPPPRYANEEVAGDRIVQPAPAATKSSWFGSRRSQQPDIELGLDRHESRSSSPSRR